MKNDAHTDEHSYHYPLKVLAVLLLRRRCNPIQSFAPLFPQVLPKDVVPRVVVNYVVFTVNYVIDVVAIPTANLQYLMLAVGRNSPVCPPSAAVITVSQPCT